MFLLFNLFLNLISVLIKKLNISSLMLVMFLTRLQFFQPYCYNGNVHQAVVEHLRHLGQILQNLLNFVKFYGSLFKLIYL